MPHAPQLAALVCVLTSQPFAATASQFANPAPQAPSVHVPVAHDSAALARSQAVPHVPQFVSVVSDVSQPLLAFPSQLPNPAAHAGAQTAAVHAVVPFAFVHATPQLPQFVVVFSGVSQPVPTTPSQLPYPPKQVIEQAPSEQAGVPFVPLQASEHPPQCATVVCVFTSQPLPPSPSQLAYPAEQAPSVQVPDAHDSEAFARSHGCPQLPQSTSVVVAVSKPFCGAPSQFA